MQKASPKEDFYISFGLIKDMMVPCLIVEISLAANSPKIMKVICLYPLRVYDFMTFLASSFCLYWLSTSFYTLSRSYFWRSVNLAITYFLPPFVDKMGDLSQRQPMVKNPYCWLFLYFSLISGLSRDSISMKSRPFALAAISSSSATRVSTLIMSPLLRSLVSCA